MSAEALLAELAHIVAEAAPADLPVVAGKLRELELLVELRLRAVTANGNGDPPEPDERPLSPEEAITIMGGGVSRKWLLRHTKGLRFRHDLSRKVVRFEEAGLRRWLAARRS